MKQPEYEVTKLYRGDHDETELRTRAAKLHARLLHDMNSDAAADWDVATGNAHNRALSSLEREFPELKAHREADERQTVNEDLRDQDKQERAKKTPRRRPSGRRSTASPGRAAPAARRSSRSRGQRAFEQTGIPGAARSVSSSFLSGLGVVIGLSMAYLFLTNAERASKGRAAIEIVAGGISKGLALVIRPVDPLVATSSSAKSAPLPKPSVNPLVNPLAAGPIDPRKAGKPRGTTPARTLPNYTDLLGATPKP